jgi:prepilin-type N-terminal cleavage/methylation domain-containing protein
MNTRKNERGLSLIEVLVAVAVLGISFIALGGAVMAGVRGTVSMGKRSIVRNQSLRYMERIQKLSFGDILDADPSVTQLNDLFDDKAEIPDVTLFQIATAVDADGRKFRIAGFEERGTWEVRINRDINGNGVIDGDENYNDVLRVEVLFEDEPILITFRTRPTQAM